MGLSVCPIKNAPVDPTVCPEQATVTFEGSEMDDDTCHLDPRYTVEDAVERDLWGKWEATPCPDTISGIRFWEEEYDSDSDKLEAEDAQPAINLEAIMVSLCTLVTIVSALQDQVKACG